GALLSGVGLISRVRILGTALFAKLQDTNQVAETPIRETLRRHWREVLLAAGTRVSENACFYVFALYLIAYAQDVLKVDKAIALHAVNVAAAIEFFTIPLFGVLSDRYSRRRVYAVGCVFLILFALPYYALLETRGTGWIILATVVALAVGHALLYSVQASLIPELFGTRLRYTGASLGYQLAAPFAGGLAPIIAAALVKAFPGHYWPLAAYIISISIVSLVCVQM